MAKNSSSLPLTEDTRTILVVILLVFVMPAGIILMWLWTTWPKWVKVLITLIPVIFMLLWMSFMLLFFTVIIQSVKNSPSGSIKYQYNNETTVYPSPVLDAPTQ